MHARMYGTCVCVCPCMRIWMHMWIHAKKGKNTCEKHIGLRQSKASENINQDHIIQMHIVAYCSVAKRGLVGPSIVW